MNVERKKKTQIFALTYNSNIKLLPLSIDHVWQKKQHRKEGKIPWDSQEHMSLYKMKKPGRRPVEFSLMKHRCNSFSLETSWKVKRKKLMRRGKQCICRCVMLMKQNKKKENITTNSFLRCMTVICKLARLLMIQQQENKPGSVIVINWNGKLHKVNYT